MRHFIKIIFFLCLIACKNHSADKKEHVTDSVMNPLTEKQELNAEDDYVVNEDIVTELLGFPINGKNINSVKLLGFGLTKTARVNAHNSSIVDTIYKYQKKATNFTFYKASDRYILSEFSILNNVIALKNGLNIGLSKPKVLEKLRLNNRVSDTIQIGDLEKNSVVSFLFKNQKLTEIKYEGYVD